MRSVLLGIVLPSLLALPGSAAASLPEPNTPSKTERDTLNPVVTISNPDATITGRTQGLLDLKAGEVEAFRGIPYAQPPVGPLRFKPPQRLTESLGDVDATAKRPVGCPQFLLPSSFNVEGLPDESAQKLMNSPFIQSGQVQGQEDCLTINVLRPAGVYEGANLPVLVWIYGGGFEFGNTATYEASQIVSNGMGIGKPFIYVAINYRVAGFGFMPGKEILADGSANAGLLDQRLGLEWVADNIEAFGGDPDKVTIWGESAGSISVFDQMILFDGKIKYKGKDLFRGAIMNSGSLVPTEPIDSPKAQQVYDTVVESAGCDKHEDTLACLRELSFDKITDATCSVPGIMSFSSVALSYLPRPDGTVLVNSPEVTVNEKKIPRIPFIIGDQKDEGTIFAFYQNNLTTTEDVADYLQTYFPTASKDLIRAIVDTYPNDPAAGSPFDTGNANNLYPQYKRLAALLGDATFTLTRRSVLNMTAAIQPDVPRYTYLSSYLQGTPVLGTFHGSDVETLFFGLLANYPTTSILSYYFNFLYNLDPNDNSGGVERALLDRLDLPIWPVWHEDNEMLEFSATDVNVIKDNFRHETFDLTWKHPGELRF